MAILDGNSREWNEAESGLPKMDTNDHGHMSDDFETLVREILSTYHDGEDRCRCREIAHDLRAAFKALLDHIENALERHARGDPPRTL